MEEYKKVVADWEKKYEQKRRDCETLKSSKANAEKKYEAQIEELKKQMHNQELTYESRIQEKEAQLSLVVGELERLKT